MYDAERKKCMDDLHYLQSLARIGTEDDSMAFYDATVTITVNGREIETAMSHQLIQALITTAERDWYNLDVAEFGIEEADKKHPDFVWMP